jgi:signal peptidase II
MSENELPARAWNLKAYLPLLAISLPIIILDQITKAVVRANLAIGEMWAPWDWLLPYARVFHVKNTGAAFGMLQDFGGVFMILSVVVSIAILYYFPQVPKEDWALRLAMGLQFGGALGNLIDRLTIGWVTDFVSVGNFAVFNVADACISIGVVVLLLGVWWKERQSKQPAEGEGIEGAADPAEADPAEVVAKET